MPKPDSIDARADLPAAFVCSSTNPGRDAAWVHVAGELDVMTAPELEQTRDAESHARLVVLDVRGVAFIDSTGGVARDNLPHRLLDIRLGPACAAFPPRR